MAAGIQIGLLGLLVLFIGHVVERAFRVREQASELERLRLRAGVRAVGRRALGRLAGCYDAGDLGVAAQRAHIARGELQVLLVVVHATDLEVEVRRAIDWAEAAVVGVHELIELNVLRQHEEYFTRARLAGRPEAN